MKFFSNTLILVIFILFLFSCSKKPDVEYTSTYKMSGEWYTRFYDNGVAVTGYHRIISSNTSDNNSNQIWVDDDHQQPFKAKFDVDYANLTFKPMASAPNAASPGKTIKVIEGKVIADGGRSKSGNTVDSIYLKLEFSEEAGTIYEIKGHQRTGFFEDEY